MDELDELQLSARDGNSVQAMVNSKGWQDVIKPAFEQRMECLVSELLNATQYEQLIRIQQSINAIRALFDFVDNVLEIGKEAIKELRGNP